MRILKELCTDDYDVLECENEQDWLNTRCFGGSSASVILGFNPYQNKLDLYNSIVLGNKHNSSNSELCEYGHNAENPLRELFSYDHKDEFIVENPPIKPIIYRSKKYSFMTATLDGKLIGVGTFDGKIGIYEGKTVLVVNQSQLKEWANGNIPQRYYCQIVHYLAVTNFDFVVVKVQFKWVSTSEDTPMKVIRTSTREYYFSREQCKDDIDYLVKTEKDFYENNILKKIPPNYTINVDL